jgi:hypothetical protein
MTRVRMAPDIVRVVVVDIMVGEAIRIGMAAT